MATLTSKYQIPVHSHDLTSILSASETQDIQKSRIEIVDFKNINDQFSYYMQVGANYVVKTISFKTSDNLFDDLCIIEKQIQNETQERLEDTTNLRESFTSIIETNILEGKGLVQLSETGGLVLDDNGNLKVDNSVVQKSLVSGIDIKTINGESLLGEGDIQLVKEMDLAKIDEVSKSNDQNSEKISSLVKQVSDMQDQIYMLKTAISSIQANCGGNTSTGGGNTSSGGSTSGNTSQGSGNDMSNQQITQMQQSISNMTNQFGQMKDWISSVDKIMNNFNTKIENIQSSIENQGPTSNTPSGIFIQRIPPYKIHAFLMNSWSSWGGSYYELSRTALEEFKFILSSGSGNVPYVMSENIFDCEQRYKELYGSINNGYVEWVKRTISSEISKVPEDGLFIFYFCGASSGNSYNTNNYIKIDSSSTITSLDETQITPQQFYYNFKTCKGKVFSIFDCSYSGLMCYPQEPSGNGTKENGVYNGYSSKFDDINTKNIFAKDKPIYVQMTSDDNPNNAKIIMFSSTTKTFSNYTDNTRILFTRAICDAWTDNNTNNILNNSYDSMTYQDLFKDVNSRYFNMVSDLKMDINRCRPLCTFTSGFTPQSSLAFS